MRPDTLPADAGASGSVRRLEPEVMDDPGLDPRAHRAALRGLARINRLSMAAGPLWRAISGIAVPGEPLRILDLATGGGDVALELWRRGRRAGVPMALTLVDASPVAVTVTRERAERLGATVDVRQCDVLHEPLPAGHDVVMSSLFFHHLQDPEAVMLLRKMAEAAGRLVLVEDLRRCHFGSGLAATVPPILTRSAVVHVDARRSARAALNVAEMLRIAASAGLGDARVRPHWPARMLLRWERNG